MADLTHDELPLLESRLAVLDEIEKALIETIDGHYDGPGDRLADQVFGGSLAVTFLGCFWASMELSGGDPSNLAQPLLVSAVVTFAVVQMALHWGKKHRQKKGSWADYIAARLKTYSPFDVSGFQDLKGKSPDGEIDVTLLLDWIKLREIPAIQKRIGELLPRATIKISD